MNADQRAVLSNMLKESYKHRGAKDTKCAICGKKNGKFAFHVIEFSIYEQNGHLDGSYPLCEVCAPPCKKCGIPQINKKVKSFFAKINAEKKPNESIRWGVGICTEHISLFGITF